MSLTPANATLIDTIDGPRDAATLRRVEGSHENETEIASWVEYWDGDCLVKRDAAVHLKQGIEALATAASVG